MWASASWMSRPAAYVMTDPFSAEEARGREAGALDERAQLQPHDLLGDLAEPGGGREAAVGGREHARRIADGRGGERDAVGDDLGVLDVVGGRVDDACDEQ